MFSLFKRRLPERVSVEAQATDPSTELDNGNYRHFPFLRLGEITAEDDDPSIVPLMPESDFASREERNARIAEFIREVRLSIERQTDEPYTIARLTDEDFARIDAVLADPNRKPAPRLTPKEFAELETEFLSDAPEQQSLRELQKCKGHMNQRELFEVLYTNLIKSTDTDTQKSCEVRTLDPAKHKHFL